MALRAVFDRATREEPKPFSSVSSASSLLLCVENLACSIANLATPQTFGIAAPVHRPRQGMGFARQGC